jgi:D-alanyl-D-alanine carboxypeptidase
MAMPGHVNERWRGATGALGLVLAAALLLAAGCGGSPAAHGAADSTAPFTVGQHAVVLPPTASALTVASRPATASPSAPPATIAAPTLAAASPMPTRPPDDLLRFVGKTGDPLPQGYVPPDLVPLPAGLSEPPGLLMRRPAAAAFAAMAAAARRDGATLQAISTYRSFLEQAQVYNDEVRTFGKAKADSEVALPGRSEHQLGTTADISIPALGYQLDDALSQTPEGRWLAAHAADFGFVLSYPAGKEAITGYRFEPWHYRYLGVDAARFIAQSGLTSTEVLRAYQAIGSEALLRPRPARTPAPCRGVTPDTCRP